MEAVFEVTPAIYIVNCVKWYAKQQKNVLYYIFIYHSIIHYYMTNKAQILYFYRIFDSQLTACTYNIWLLS